VAFFFNSGARGITAIPHWLLFGVVGGRGGCGVVHTALGAVVGCDRRPKDVAGDRAVAGRRGKL